MESINRVLILKGQETAFLAPTVSTNDLPQIEARFLFPPLGKG